jgi:deoxycytidylate deaminase
MDHIKNMQLAERAASGSECPERKVGAVLVLPNGGSLMGSNQEAWDDTNGHHAEAWLLQTAELMRLDTTGATLYTTCRPCVRCTNMLKDLGLKAIYYRDRQPEMNHLMLLGDVHLDGRWIMGQVQDGWASRNGVQS